METTSQSQKIQMVMEILTQEAERYNLSSLGFFRNIKEEAEKLASNLNESIEEPLKDERSFEQWKEQLLTKFYLTKEFGEWAKWQKSNPSFRQTFKSLLPDKLLAQGNPIEYKLYNLLFDTYFDTVYNNAAQYQTPLYITEYLSTLFPLDMQTFVNKLSSCQSKFWKGFIKIISNISYTVIRKNSWSIGSTKDESEYLSSEVYHIILEKLNKNEPLEFETVSNLRSYIFSIANNKQKELFRERKNISLYDEFILPDNDGYIEEDNYSYSENIVLREIDTTNPTEIANAFLEIFCNPTHPLYQKLIEGEEKKVKVLKLYELEGLSYQEIAETIYGNLEEMSPQERKRIYDKVRQDKHRAQQFLKEHFMRMIADAKKSWHKQNFQKHYVT